MEERSDRYGLDAALAERVNLSPGLPANLQACVVANKSCSTGGPGVKFDKGGEGGNADEPCT